MAKREFVQLAHDYVAKKHGIGGWWWSEKIDGHRAFWDGGITTGMPKEMVPWANTNKDERFVEQQFASGLWSRYGNVIHAPIWWTKTLPKIPLGGELYNSIRGNREYISSIVKQIHPDARWNDIDLYVFNSPPLQTIFADGRINNIHYKKTFKGIIDWINQQHFPYEKVFEANARFRSIYHYLISAIPIRQRRFVIHQQYSLPFHTTLAKEQTDFQNQRISEGKGEGLIVRNPDSLWIPERCHTIVKIKSYKDDEATVLGYVTGRETDKGSRLLGLMGAMIVEWQGKIFEISGFNDYERVLIAATQPNAPLEDCLYNGRQWAIENPETECPNWIHARNFPRGSRVTFKYAGLTSAGIPNPANYWRKEEIL